jgi:hypothetical protein
VKHPIHAALAEHAPRAASDPLYVPFWAKDPKGDFSWALSDGTLIRAGRVVREGTGEFRERLPTPPRAETVEVRVRARLDHDRKSAKSTDVVLELVRANPHRDQRVALCRQHGIDPAILDGAPNAGVATMRLVNALRRVGLS